MSARILAIAGPQKGSRFLLTCDQTIIGRDTANEICLIELSASRKHCAIARTDSGFHITDLDSINGTFVNGIPIRERNLHSGDRIELGDSLLLFLEHEEESAPDPIQVAETTARSTVRLRLEDALYLEPEKLLKSAPLNLRIAHGLDAILKLSKSIPSIRKSDELYKKLLETAFSVIPAQRGSIILLEGEESSVVFSCDKNLNTVQTQFSNNLSEEVIRDRMALISNDVQSDSGLSSLIAAPMIYRNVLDGILCLETTDSRVKFDEDHLQLASAVASIGAGAMDGMRHLEQLQRDHRDLVEDIQSRHTIIGESNAIKEVYGLIAKVAPSPSTVLICGETGTGKELVARAIHWNSPRSEKPFVVINCTTLSESLLESELFGHEKGAFTGALAQKKGKLEMADEGTVFLDEIGEISPAIQSKLLRLLQEREFERVGGTRQIKVDVRVLAATNKPLQEAIRNGSFRSDLYYRLNVVQIQMPPLRERREDIPLLASYFVSKYSKKLCRKVKGISEQARQTLLNYDWPGNVRELENTIERAVVLGSEEVILQEDLPEVVLDGSEVQAQHPSSYYQLLREMKKKLIREALEKSNGNHADAARRLGIHPNNFYRMRNLLKLK